MGTIILVRHGENDWSKQNKLAGWIPGVHLNDEGQEQAAAAAERLARLPIRAVYSSPVTRCMETAAYIADTHRLAVLQNEGVGELRFGRWEGKKIKKLARKPGWWLVQHRPSRARFPDGESMLEAQFRAVQAIEALARRHEKDTIVVVAHADVIRLALAHYMGIHIDLFQRLVISPASISVLDLDSRGLIRVSRVNDNGPLQPPTQPDKPAKAQKATDKEQQKAGNNKNHKKSGGKTAEPVAASATGEQE